MEKIQELTAQRAAKIDAFAALTAKMNAEDYDDKTSVEAKATDNQVYGELKAEIEEVAKKIDRTQAVITLKASLAKPVEGQQQPRMFAQPRKRHMKLKAFKGANAEEDAYRVGQWIKGAIFGDDDSRQWCKDNGIAIVKAQSEGVNSAGGFLVPPEMMNTIIDLREEFGVFRKNAQLVPMSSDSLDWPRRAGGLTAFFVAEGAAITESSASWDNVTLVAKKLGVLTRISTELSEDAVVSVADLMTREIAYAFSAKEDDCGFNGDGTSTYGGIRGITQLIIDGNHNTGKVAAAGGHPTFATLDGTDIANLIGRLPQYALPRAKFYCSSVGFAVTFERLTAAAGGNSISTLDGSVQYRYLGFPIVIAQKLPTITTTLNGSVMMLFGDLALASAMGERRVVTIKRSDERYFEQDQIGILGTERVDIVNHDLGDNTVAGPIVGLVGTT
jgi:HK97 family phage major capsid protein